MNIRLSLEDRAHIVALQRFFSEMDPVGIDLSNVNAVRVALRISVRELKISDETIGEITEELRNEDDPS